MKTRNLGTLWLMVLMCSGLLLTTGCGGGGGGSLGTSPGTGGSNATTSIALDIDTTIPTAVKFSTGREARTLSLATAVNMFRIRVVDPQTIEDLIPPVTVPRSVTTPKQRIFLRVPVRPILILVEAFTTDGQALAHASIPLTPDPTLGQFTPIDVDLTPGPLPTPTPVPTATPTPTPTPTPTAPAISSITPSSGPLAGGTSVTIAGANFGISATVTIGTSPATVTAVNPSTITLDTPPSAVVGPQDVTVNVSAGTVTSTAGFTYNGTPTITSVSPASGGQTGGTVLTIGGTNLLGTVTVSVGGVPATVTGVTGGTTLTCVTGASGTAGTPVDVVVNASASGSVTATSAYTYNAAPTITSVTPSIGGPLAGGTTLTIVGTNFGGTVNVTVGGAAATVSASNATTITATSPASAVAGTVALVVDSSTNGTATSSFTYNAAPTISLVSPSTGDEAGGTPIVITGTGFLGTVSVDIGGAAATSVNVTGTTQISCVTPPGSAGARTLTVTSTAAGSGTSTFTYFTPVNITSISPSTGAPLAGGNTVTIGGVGFLGTLGVTIGGNTAAITGSNSTTITATAPAGAAAGAVDVVVTSSTNGSNTVVGGYTYNPLPTISAVTPNAGLLAGGNNVTITGANFGTTASVLFGANPGVNPVVSGGNSILVVAPAAAATGPVTLTVNSPTHGVTTSTYTYVSAPTITSVAPLAGGPLVGGNTLTIEGTNLLGTVNVTVGSAAATVTSVDSAGTTVTAIAPAAGASGTVTVTLVSDISGTATGTYTYNDPPTVSSVTPSQGLEVGGELVDVDGLNFTGNITVTFNGAPATIQSVSPTTISVLTPPGTGLANVAVISDTRGTGTLAAGFNYLPAPTLVSATPNNGPLVGGNTVVLSGANYGGTMNVTFGANVATVLASDSTTITVTAPGAVSPGTVDVGITSSTNGFFNAAGAYTYNPQITLTAPLSPNSGPLAGSTNVTISGTNVFNVTEVSFGANLGTSSASILGGLAATIDTPAGAAPGQVTVTVTSTSHGVASLPLAFTYNPTLAFSALAPVAAVGRERAGDMNRDGLLDAVEADNGGDAIRVRLNTGGGVLGAPTTTNVTPGTFPADLVLGDFDRDGNLDVATANASSSVHVLFGDAGGNLTPTVEVTSTALLIRIESADLDRDGDLDLIAHTPSGGVFVVRNTGARTFAASTLEDALGGRFQVADFTRDGVPDLIALSANVVRLLAGVGNGTFTPTTTVTITATPNDLAVGDFDRNGTLDIAVLDTTAATIAVLSGDGAGGLTPVGSLTTTSAMNLDVADVNGDGVLDLVTQSSADADVRVHEGTGTGTFYAEQSVATLGATGAALTTADMDGDGRADVLATDSGGNLTVVSNTTAWLQPTTVTAQPVVTLPAGTQAGLAAGDFNRDGRFDLAATLSGAAQVRTLGGSGGGGFATLNSPTVGTTPSGVAVADFDGDGRPDLATANAGSGTVSILIDDGSGGYAAAASVAAGTAPFAIAAGDMDNDGDVDLVVADGGAALDVLVLLNDGAGAFPTTLSTANGGVRALALVDWDRNGLLDVVVGLTSGNVGFLTNTGGGALSVLTLIVVVTSPAGLATGDFNEDGIPDVAVSASTNDVTVALNDGAGGVLGATAFPVGANPQGVAAVDLDRDGDLDLVAANAGAGTVSVLRGDGAGSFTGGTSFAVGASPSAVLTGDFNGDGLPDLAVSNAGDATLSILLAR